MSSNRTATERRLTRLGRKNGRLTDADYVWLLPVGDHHEYLVADHTGRDVRFLLPGATSGAKAAALLAAR